MLDLAFIREVGPLRWAWRMFWRQLNKRMLRRDLAVRLPTGLRMTLPRMNQFAGEVYVTGCSVDWGTEAVFCSLLSPDGDLIDVGANIGYYTLYCLPRVRAACALEPDPRVWGWLQANLSRHATARAFPVAAGARCESTRLLLGRTPEQSRLAAETIATAANSVTVKVVTVDAFAAQHGLCPTGIKIDVEGLDLEVLRGALATLAAHQPLVILETRPTAELFALIQPLDYAAYGFVRDHTAKACRLRRLPPDPHLHTKMIFLAPRRLHDRFATLAARS